MHELLLVLNALVTCLLALSHPPRRKTEREPDPFTDPHTLGRRLTVASAVTAFAALFAGEIVNSAFQLIYDPLTLKTLLRWTVWTIALVPLYRAHPSARWVLGFLLLGSGGTARLARRARFPRKPACG